MGPVSHYRTLASPLSTFGMTFVALLAELIVFAISFARLSPTLCNIR
jgi:hypothetical protein